MVKVPLETVKYLFKKELVRRNGNNFQDLYMLGLDVGKQVFGMSISNETLSESFPVNHKIRNFGM